MSEAAAKQFIEQETEIQRLERLWNLHGLENIKPNSPRFGEFPEGWNAVAEVRRIVGPFVKRKVLELGCGYGRLALAFPEEQYIGIDINAAAVAAARQKNQGYDFRHVAYVDNYPDADTLLAYAVFQHIPDEAVQGIAGRLAAGAFETVVIAEILDSEGRDTNRSNNYAPAAELHSVFAREAGFYAAIFASKGFVLAERVIKPYFYYAGAEISFLIFRRQPPPPQQLALPAGLADPYLVYEGIFDDGWLAPEASVVMHWPESAKAFELRGLSLLSEGAVLEISVDMDGLVQQTSLPHGEFTLAVPAAPPAGKRRVTLKSPAMALPAPDGRTVGILLRAIAAK